ncbi:MAG: HAMP domain-containing protein [Gammaproteobacteria bacterium]|nr:HAMP domain-containing protein [Gammaproteobacteria bacterium]
MKSRIGIRGRLFIAFGLVVIMTVVTGMIGWLSYSKLGESLHQVVQTNIPTMSLVAELSERGAAITGIAPALAVAEDELEREKIWALLFENLQGMDALLVTAGDSPDDVPVQGSLTSLVESLTSNLRELDENVRRRLWYRSIKEEQTQRLRWISADFLDEVEPMIDDTQFNIEVRLNQANAVGSKILIGAGKQDFNVASVNQQALFRIKADGNLLTGLIGRAPYLPDYESLRASELYLHEVQSRLYEDLAVVEGIAGSLSLHQSLEDILGFASGEQSLFDQRREELEILLIGKQLLERNRKLIEQLNHLISTRVERARDVAAKETLRSQQSIGRGKLWMLITVSASLILSVAIVWLYVGRSMVGRIARLDTSMLAIADGYLETEVPVEGSDEISDMAMALRTFRDQLLETQAELVQAGKLAALGQLSAGIAHEINQPLAAIRHYARNGEKFYQRGNHAEVQGNLEKISELSERVHGVIKQLNSMARKPSKGLYQVDLAEVIQNVLLLLEGTVKSCGAKIKISIDPDSQKVLAGQLRLEQVMLNLLTNALHAIENEDEKIVSISASLQRNQVELSIHDTGPGVTEEYQKHVFDPFFTTKEIGKGLGLGLPISYNIIRDFGGSLSLDTNRDGGATFRISLLRE